MPVAQPTAARAPTTLKPHDEGSIRARRRCTAPHRRAPHRRTARPAARSCGAALAQCRGREPDRRHRAGDRRVRQAPADPARRRPHACTRTCAWKASGRSTAQAPATRRPATLPSARCSPRTPGPPPVGTSGCSTCCAPTTSTGSSTGWAPTCSAPSSPPPGCRRPARLVREPDRPVCAALLDQRTVAGIGTIWMAESLFARRLFPWTSAGALAEEEREDLLRTARRLMERSVTVGRARGLGAVEMHAHGRAGRPCHRCGTPISVGSANEKPYERPVFWCPTCQAPRHRSRTS